MDPQRLARGGQVALAERGGLLGVGVVVGRGQGDQQQDAVDRAIGPALAGDQEAEVAQARREPLDLVGVLQERPSRAVRPLRRVVLVRRRATTPRRRRPGRVADRRRASTAADSRPE